MLQKGFIVYLGMGIVEPYEVKFGSSRDLLCFGTLTILSSLCHGEVIRLARRTYSPSSFLLKHTQHLALYYFNT